NNHRRKETMRDAILILRQTVICGAVMAALLASARPAAAVTYTWNHFVSSAAGVSGAFDNASNWSPSNGPPEELDTASIGVSEANVTFGSDWSVGALNLFGRADFGMNGHTLTTGGLTTGYYSFNSTLYNADFRLTDGTLRLNGNANLGAGSGPPGDMIIDGAALMATDYVRLATDNSSYSLTVRNGGSFSAGGTNGSYVGGSNSGVATVT